MYKSNTPLFDLFWENSKLDNYNYESFSKEIEKDSRIGHNIAQLYYPTEDKYLTTPTDNLAKIMKRRKSDREFNNYSISEKQLSSLFYGFSQKNNMTRLLPSAGGKFPIEIFAFLFNVKGELNKKVVYYNPDYHSLSIVNECKSRDEIKDISGLRLEGKPSILFVFVSFSERVTQKYGERGGRFSLIEVGHYAQNLGLRISQEELKGVEAGGLNDNEIKKELKLEDTNALITLGFACGM